MGTGQGAGPVEELASQIGATAVVVCDHRKELLCAGQPSVAVHCRSIGKTLLGALFGRHVASGAIELDATPADPGIDDSVPPSLTSEEWSARVRDLLTCRPGICHPADHQGEAPAPRCRRAEPTGRGATSSTTTGTSTRSAPSSNARSARACSPSSPRPSPAHRACGTSTPPASGTPPRAGHGTALTLPHLRPRPGTLRPAPPQPRRVRHAQRDPAGSGHCQHRPRTRPAAAPPTATCGGSNTTASSFTGTTVPAGSLAAYGMGGQFRLVIPAIDRVIALLADQQRPGGSGRGCPPARLGQTGALRHRQRSPAQRGAARIRSCPHDDGNSSQRHSRHLH